MGRYEFSVNERFRRKNSGFPFYRGPSIDEDYELIDDIMSAVSEWASENSYSLDTEYTWGAEEGYAEFGVLDDTEEILDGKVVHRNISEKGMRAKGPKRGSRRKINVDVSGKIEAKGPDVAEKEEESLREWIYSQVK